MGLGIIAVFEHRPLSYVLVNGGYLTVALTVMGAILAGGDKCESSSEDPITPVIRRRRSALRRAG